jgi:hypothetical protein
VTGLREAFPYQNRDASRVRYLVLALHAVETMTYDLRANRRFGDGITWLQKCCQMCELLQNGAVVSKLKPAFSLQSRANTNPGEYAS